MLLQLELRLESDLHGHIEVAVGKSSNMEGWLCDFDLVNSVRRVKDVCHTLYVFAHLFSSIIDRELHGPSIRLARAVLCLWVVNFFPRISIRELD